LGKGGRVFGQSATGCAVWTISGAPRPIDGLQGGGLGKLGSGRAVMPGFGPAQAVEMQVLGNQSARNRRPHTTCVPVPLPSCSWGPSSFLGWGVTIRRCSDRSECVNYKSVILDNKSHSFLSQDPFPQGPRLPSFCRQRVTHQQQFLWVDCLGVLRRPFWSQRRSGSRDGNEWS
jgi:hypothetical protein